MHLLRTPSQLLQSHCRRWLFSCPILSFCSREIEASRYDAFAKLVLRCFEHTSVSFRSEPKRSKVNQLVRQMMVLRCALESLFSIATGRLLLVALVCPRLSVHP